MNVTAERLPKEPIKPMDRSTHEYIKTLKIYKGILPKQTIRTLRGQALSGDLIGAKKGLDKVLKKGRLPK